MIIFQTANRISPSSSSGLHAQKTSFCRIFTGSTSLQSLSFLGGVLDTYARNGMIYLFSVLFSEKYYQVICLQTLNIHFQEVNSLLWKNLKRLLNIFISLCNFVSNCSNDEREVLVATELQMQVRRPHILSFGLS